MARLRKSLLTVGLLLGLALAVTVLWREVVVEAAARLALSAGGLEDARFRVVGVDWREIVVEDVSLGAGLPAARRLRLRYAPGELAFGRVREVRVEGMRVAVPADWDAARARLAELASGGGEGWVSVSRIAFEDAAIALAEPDEGMIAVDGALDFSGASPGAALEIALMLGRTEARFTARSDELAAGGAVEIDGAGTYELAGLRGLGLEEAALNGGRAAFTVAGAVPIPADPAAGPGAWLDEALALEGDLRISEAAFAGGTGNLSADVGWALRGARSGVQLALPRPARLDVAGIGPRVIEALRLAADEAPRDLSLKLSAAGPVLTWSPRADGGRAEFAGTLDLGLGEAGAIIQASATLVHDASWQLAEPAKVAFRAAATGWDIARPEAAARLREAAWNAAGSVGRDGTIELRGRLSAETGELRLGALDAETVALDGGLRVGGTPARWSVRLAPGAALSVVGAAVPGRIRVEERAVLTLDRLELTGNRRAVRLDLSGATSGLSGILFEGGGHEFVFADAGGRVALDLDVGAGVNGEARLEAVEVALPGEALKLTEISAELPLGGDAEGGTVRLSAALRGTGRNARFAPIRLDLEGEPEGARLAVSGNVETSNGAVRLPVSGSVDIAGATVRMTAGPTRVTFRPGGLQPSALSPDLASFSDVSGAVSIGGDVSVDTDGAMRSRLQLAFDDVAARSGGLEVVGLSGELALSGLSPLATAGAQSLSARRVIAGLPVERLRASFTIPPRAGQVAQVHRATAALAGGELAVEDARWDAGAARNSVIVHVRDVSLERLLSEWQIEGITGTGRLSGVIPVRVVPDGLVVEGGRLEADGAGVISVDWGSARETLVGSGEQVALTVRALEDFRYETLTIAVDRPADGTLTLGIGLEGNSPEVLDGHPFRFNIALSGKLEPILAAVREGRRIGADLIRGGLGGR